MNDLNFFSVLKKQREKNKAARIIMISIVVLIIVMNAALFGFGYFAFSKLESHINNNKAFINAPATKEKVREAKIVSQENAIANEYLTLMKKAASQFENSNRIKLELIDYIRSLTPATTFFQNADFVGSIINLDCYSSQPTDPINFYHKLINDERFASVTMPGIKVESNTVVTFNIQITLKGGMMP